MLRLGKDYVVLYFRLSKSKKWMSVLHRALVNLVEEEMNTRDGNTGNANIAKAWLSMTGFNAETSWAQRYGYKNPDPRNHELEDDMD